MAKGKQKKGKNKGGGGRDRENDKSSKGKGKGKDTKGKGEGKGAKGKGNGKGKGKGGYDPRAHYDKTFLRFQQQLKPHKLGRYAVSQVFFLLSRVAQMPVNTYNSLFPASLPL
jgi:hypothetical protein